MIRIPYEPPTFEDAVRAIAANERRKEDLNKTPEFRAKTDAAKAAAAAAARMLKEKFGATRVRLYGSLARGDADEGFDVDLCVEGIEWKRFSRAWSEAAAMIRRDLDFVDIREATPLLRKYIERDGVDLP